jgi:anti-anti-sigma factor
MKIWTETFDGAILKINLEGRMDAPGMQEIEQEFMDYACSQRSVIVDMNAVDFLASMGIRTLILAAKAVSRRGGKMVLLNPDAYVTRVLQMVGDLIPIHRSLNEARRAVSV